MPWGTWAGRFGTLGRAFGDPWEALGGAQEGPGSGPFENTKNGKTCFEKNGETCCLGFHEALLIELFLVLLRQINYI